MLGVLNMGVITLAICAFLSFAPVVFGQDLFSDSETNSNGNATNNVSETQVSIKIQNDLDYDIAPMSLEIGIARGFAASLLAPVDELGDTNAISNVDLSGVNLSNLFASYFPTNQDIINEWLTNGVINPNEELLESSEYKAALRSIGAGDAPELILSVQGNAAALGNVVSQMWKRFENGTNDTWLLPVRSTPPTFSLTNFVLPGATLNKKRVSGAKSVSDGVAIEVPIITEDVAATLGTVGNILRLASEVLVGFLTGWTILKIFLRTVELAEAGDLGGSTGAHMSGED